MLYTLVYKVSGSKSQSSGRARTNFVERGNKQAHCTPHTARHWAESGMAVCTEF